MVMRLFITLLCFGMFANVNAATAFNVTADKTEVQLGKYIVLQLYARTAGTALANIDLTALEKDFHIDTSTNTETLMKNGVAVQSWRIHLYPYHTGKYQIPALFFNDVHSRPRNITVTDAIDPRTNQPFHVEHQVSSLTPWQRQQVLITTTITTDNKFALLEANNDKLKNLDILTATPHKQQLVNSQTRYTVGWAVFPLLSGTQNLSDFVINYSHQGKVTHRFYSPSYQLRVKPLPLYVPPTIPVGKVAIRSGNAVPFINTTQSLQYWDISLAGSGLPTYFMPMLEAQINSSKQSAFYPVAPAMQQTVTVAGVNTTVHYRIPYKILQQGFYSLPSLKLNYFDPDSGKLVDAIYTPATTIVTTRLILGIVITLLALLVTYILMRLIRLIIYYYQYVKNYLHSMTELLTAQSCQELKSALLKIRPLPSQYNNPNTTLQNWQQNWQKVYTETPGFIMDLTRAIYRGETIDLISLRKQAVSYVARKWWQRAFLRFTASQSLNT